MSELSNISCIPCRTGTLPASAAEIAEWLPHLPDWQIISTDNVRRLTRSYRYRTFQRALGFTNRIDEIAEAEQHQLAILIEWGQVTVNWLTHKISGLRRNDFIMAAKTDHLYAG